MHVIYSKKELERLAKQDARGRMSIPPDVRITCDSSIPDEAGITVSTGEHAMPIEPPVESSDPVSPEKARAIFNRIFEELDNIKDRPEEASANSQVDGK